MQYLLDERRFGNLSTPDFLRIQTESVYPRIRHSSRHFPSKMANAVNTIDVDRRDCQFLLSGGSDSSIHLFKCDSGALQEVSSIPRKVAHDFGVSHVSWWPQDAGMFVSSSFDHKIKVWDTSTLEDVYSFDIGSRIYNFDISDSNSQPLLACGNDTPMIRLLDLRSTSTSHTLSGHKGRVLAVKWSPTNSNILASGGIDGNVRLWDVRRGNSCIYDFNANDTIEDDTSESFAIKRRKLSEDNRAHDGAVNGLLFNESGNKIVTCGLDEKIRVWDLTSPSRPLNELVNFGPLVRNKFSQHLEMALSPRTETEMQFLWFPNDNGEILVFRVIDGKLIARLSQGSDAKRVTCVKYGGNRSCRYFSGNLDGSLNIWSEGLASKDRPGKIQLQQAGETEEAKSTSQTMEPDILNRIQAEIEAKKLVNSSGYSRIN
ncbi:unnamed protein product [Kuraishia capsulata CBS 1993]|uniref:Uncharacterized protein n=1 Tax=Kuraishia capsulata CBS 1993 TaxID=1382522 RepID=W6MF53_9ASCO|nr:uncharacterized protein KUCA_T00000249001 [Kuraishia capsulata CBS 1993]CDK24289.1 unnamed protein product [Kuraishia capsulata CBS 1993]